MTRANKKFFTEFRKEITEDKTPINPLDAMEIPSIYVPGREPSGSMAFKEYINLAEECKKKDVRIAELEEQLKNVQPHRPDCESIKNNAVREFVEHLIIYAEKEERKVAREIKIALTTKMANGYIAREALSTEWKQRLENLGRDKPMRSNAMNFNNQVGTIVAHADHVTLQYRDDE